MKRHVLMGMLVFLAVQAGTGRAQEDGPTNKGEMQAKAAKRQSEFSAKVAGLLSDLPFGRLYSIESDFNPKGVKDREHFFQGFPILGSVDLNSAEQRRIIYGALMRAVAQGGDVMECFDPHHALRVFKEGESYDFIICFSCLNLQSDLGNCPVGSAERKTFDDFLTLYKVPLKAKPELTSKPQP